MALVLLSEPDGSVRRFLTGRLEREGFEVALAADATSPVLDVAARDPDVLIVALEQGSDLEPLLRVRQRSDVPTIALLAADLDLSEQVVLDGGADDCLRKPLSPGELAARVRAVLRRTGTRRPATRLEFPGLEIDMAGRLATVDGDVVDLPQREFDLLVFLASSPGQVFTRQQVLERVWKSSDAWQGATTVTEHVYRLRRRLGPGHGPWIQTVRSIGYRFTPS